MCIESGLERRSRNGRRAVSTLADAVIRQRITCNPGDPSQLLSVGGWRHTLGDRGDDNWRGPSGPRFALPDAPAREASVALGNKLPDLPPFQRRF